MKEIRIYPSDWQLVRKFGDIAQVLRRRGRVMSPADITLAALAILKKAVVLTTDSDFDALSDVTTDNWLA